MIFARASRAAEKSERDLEVQTQSNTLTFGFIGLLVAVPALAAGMVAVKMLYVETVVGDDPEVHDRGPKGQAATEGKVAT